MIYMAEMLFLQLKSKIAASGHIENSRNVLNPVRLRN